MTITSELRDDGIRVVTMEHPPVNALTVQGWFDVAAALDDVGGAEVRGAALGGAARASAVPGSPAVNATDTATSRSGPTRSAPSHA